MKLTWKLALAFAAVSGMVWVVGMYAVSRSERETKRLLTAETRHLGNEVLEHLVETASHRIGALRQYANSPLLVSQVRDLVDRTETAPSGDDAARVDRLWQQGTIDPALLGQLSDNPVARDLKRRVSWYEQERGSAVYGEIFVTDRLGRNIAQSGRTSDYIQSDEPWWQKAREAGVFVEPVEFDTSSGLHTMSVCIRIDDPEATDPDKVFLGVLKATLNTREAAAIIDSAVSTGDSHTRSASATLLTSDRRIIATTNSPEHAEKLLERATSVLDKGKSGDSFVTRIDDVPLHVVSLVSPPRDYVPGWILLIDYDSNEVFAPSRRLKAAITRIATIGTIFSIGLGLALAWPLRRRLDRLTRAAAAIGRGNLDVPLEQQGSDEVGRLSGAFTRVRDTLTDISGDLGRLSSSVTCGLLTRRAEAERFEGDFAELVHGINRTVDSMVGHLDAVPTGLMVVDRQFRVVFANREALKMADQPGLDDVLNKPCRTFFGGHNCQGTCCPREAMETGQPCSAEKELVIQEESRVYHIMSVPVRDAGGKVVGAMEVLTDRTEATMQSRIQQAALEVSKVLAEGDELADILDDSLRALMHCLGGHVGAVYLADQEHRGQYLLERTVGATPDMALPASVEPGEGFIARAVRSGQVTVTDNVDGDRFLLSTLNGPASPATLVEVPLLQRNEVIGVVCLATLKPLAPYHRRILDLVRSPLAVAVTNARTNRATRLLAEQLQLSNEELNASNEELKAQSEELRQQALELREQAARLHQQQEQIREADRLKSEFLSNMSHELRTPLNSVLALSQLMLNKGVETDPKKHNEYLGVIERNGRHLLNLINELLDLSKIEAGRMDVNLESFDINDVVDDVAETIRPLAGQKGLTFKLDLSDSCAVVGDRDRVRQILINLLSNAVKFTDHGSVRLKTRLVDGRASIEVRDTGVGIASSQQAFIFDEFRQGDGSTTRRYGGTGLGLAISRKLARMMNGDIVMESQPEQGSTFTLTLPTGAMAEQAGDGDAPSVSPAARPAEDTGTRRVLVVEDNEVASEQILSVLEDLDVEGRPAWDGAEALEMLRDHEFDAVILDLMMPGVDGFEVLERIRRGEAGREVPVLVLSAKDLSGDERQRLKEAPVYRLMQKGTIDRGQLTAVVRRLLGLPAPDQRGLWARSSMDLDPTDPSESDARPTELPDQVEQPSDANPTDRGDDPTEAPARPEPAEPSVGEGEPIILVVEDHPDNMLAIRAVLDDRGYRIVGAGDGRQGVDEARRHRPSIILMDMQLPVMSGYDATRSLKSDPVLKAIPIVGLTARAMQGDREQVLAAGCDDYLAKPFNPDDLWKVVLKWTA